MDLEQMMSDCMRLPLINVVVSDDAAYGRKAIRTYIHSGAVRQGSSHPAPFGKGETGSMRGPGHLLSTKCSSGSHFPHRPLLSALKNTFLQPIATSATHKALQRLWPGTNLGMVRYMV